MKKTFVTVGLIATLCGSMLLTSCIGSFQLTNKLLTWNKTIGNKFVNELVFIAFWVLPVYEVSGLADFLVLNSIEFWSGSNPVACGTFRIDRRHGEKYLVTCDKKGYTVVNELDKSTFRFNFNADTQEWSTNVNGEEVVFLTFIDDTHVKVPMTDGTTMTVELNEQGLFAYSEALGCDLVPVIA